MTHQFDGLLWYAALFMDVPMKPYSGSRTAVLDFEAMWNFGRNFETDSFHRVALFGHWWQSKGLENSKKFCFHNLMRKYFSKFGY